MAMGHLERIVAALTHKTPDRVPVVAVCISRSLRETGYGLLEALHDPKKIAESKIAAHEKYEDDGIVAGLDLFVEAEALGAETSLREHVPIVVGFPLAKNKDMDKLNNIAGKLAGRMEVVVEEIKILKQRYGDSVAIVPLTGGPVTTAANLRGVENLLLDMLMDPQYVHELLKLTTEVSKVYVEALCKAGAHAVILLDPISSNTILSPDQYREFVAPYQRQIFDICNKHQVVGINHVCADTSLIWEQMVDVGAPAIQIDFPIDIADCKRRVGDKTCIMGNVNPVEVMLFGTPDDVYNRAIECIKKTAKGSGFILTPGCDLNPNTPEENIKALVRAAKAVSYDEQGNLVIN